MYYFQSVITADGSKFIERHTGTALNQAEMDIERWVEGDTMILVRSHFGFGRI